MKPSTGRAPMALTLGIWLCTVPFILLLVTPWLGLKGALVVAVALAAVMAMMCSMLCMTRTNDLTNEEENLQ